MSSKGRVTSSGLARKARLIAPFVSCSRRLLRLWLCDAFPGPATARARQTRSRAVTEMQCLAPPARCHCLTGSARWALASASQRVSICFHNRETLYPSAGPERCPRKRCPRLPNRRLYGVLTAISALLPCACQLKSQVSQRRVAKEEEVAICKVVEARQRMCTILQRAVQESLGV